MRCSVDGGISLLDKAKESIRQFRARPKKVVDTKYAYLSVLLNSRSIRMLTRDKMERMINASSYEECAKMLEECGYGDLSKAEAPDIEAELSRHRAELFDEISALSPQPAIVDAFRLKYDYHNVKTLIKAEGVGIDGQRLISDSGRVDVKTLVSAFVEENYEKLPPKLAKGMDEAKGVLSRTANPQLADIILDKLQFDELGNCAWQLRSPFFSGYVKLLADIANLRIIVRALRMGRDADFIRGALIPEGSVDAEALFSGGLKGDEILAAYGKNELLTKAAELGTQALSSGNLTEFELSCDNAATFYLSRAREVGFGQEPVIIFLACLESEITAARMILIGRLRGLEPRLIQERLRESYA